MLCRGENGPIAYSLDKFEEWDNYTSKDPLLVHLPSPPTLYGKLYDHNRPFQTTDGARTIIRSAALMVKKANISGYSLLNPFTKGNVGVIRSIDCVAFRSLQLDPSGEWMLNKSAGYNQMSAFMKNSIMETHSALPSQMPRQLEIYFEDLDRQNVDEDFITDHPTTMTSFQYYQTCQELYWYLIRDNDPKDKDIAAVLAAIGLEHPNALSNVIRHEFLYQFLPWTLVQQLPTLVNQKSPPVRSDKELGIVVVEVCRHCIAHGRDKKIRMLLQNTLNQSGYSRDDLTEVLRAVYASYINAAYRVLVAQDNLKKLNNLKSPDSLNNLRIRERNPVPSIFQAPASGIVSFNDYLVFMEKKKE